jgi:CO dehydrogenase maturation factor
MAPVKVGIVGKGGVGKTTVSALLARRCAAAGRRVVAIDTDSNPNLGVSLGLSQQDAEDVPVLPRSVIAGPGGTTTAADLIAEFGRATPAGVTLLSAIRVTEAGAGCTCGGHATVRSLLGDVLAATADVTVVDMEAGIEHLSRSGGTLAYVDALLVVVEPSRKSVITASRTAALATELGIPRVLAVGNKVRDNSDADFLRREAAGLGIPVVAVLPYQPLVAEADRAGAALPGAFDAAVTEQADRLMALVDSLSGPGAQPVTATQSAS